MKSIKTIVMGVVIAIGFQSLSASLHAQGGEKFKARLAPAPALGIRPADVVGIGSASATLTGRKVAITGTFEKLASAATSAKLHIGQLTGVRGDALFDLTLTKDATGNSGSIAGNFDLTPAQVDALKKGRLHITVYSEGAKNGHLLGWLLK